MSTYHFKQWLSFEEAAAWLTDTTKEPFTTEMLENALLSKLIIVHVWAVDRPEVHLVGNFDRAVIRKGGMLLRIDSESRPPIDVSVLTDECIFAGPIPIQDFLTFKLAMERDTSNPLGITVLDAQAKNWVCYPLKNDDIGSFSDERIVYLFHLSDLKGFADQLPHPQPIPTGLIKYLGLKHRGSDEMEVEASSYVAGNSPLSWDLPNSEAYDGRDQHATNEPALRALGFAAHLIAELGAKLDALETLPSQHLDFRRGDRPNASRIADALADIAKTKRHEGHGVRGAGFRKLIAQALKSVD